MMMESDAGGQAAASPMDADAADVQEQQRPAQDEPIDPEQSIRENLPDGSSIESDPADAQDQSMEVPDEDE